MNGPAWINLKDMWLEQRYEVISVNVITDVLLSSPIFNASEISSLTKVLNITTKVFQFINTLRPETALPSAMNYWLHQIQREHYKNEYDFLNAAEISNTPDLIKSLGLYHDPETRLIHCRGGLSNSAMSVSAQFPILLPRRSWLTTLLVRKAHTHVLHGGVADTLSSLQEQCWIPRGRQVIKALLRPCVVCKTIEGRPFKLPGPPSLPKERVIHTEPLHTV